MQAMHLYDLLTRDGFTVSFDIDSMNNEKLKLKYKDHLAERNLILGRVVK